jgi:hypothetical protein
LQYPRWAFVLAGTACLLLLAPLAGATNSSLYDDATADARGMAPDLAGVQVANDDAGNVVFRIAISNRSALDHTDLVALMVDADGKTGTGCARGVFGAEFALDVLANRYVFGRCTRGQWDFSKRPASFSGAFAGSTLTLKANRRDLGGTSQFDFRIGAAATTEADPAYDFAPDIGTSAWSYQVIAPPPHAVMKPPTRKHKPCRHRARRCRLTRR